MTQPAQHPRQSKRLAVAAGSIGLVAGLGLGATGLASATAPVSASMTTAADGEGKQRQHPKKGAGKGRGFGGLVTAVSASSLTTNTPWGSKTVGVNDATVYYEGKDKVAASAIEVGEVVIVRLADPKSTTPMAAVVKVVPAHVVGWVKDVLGTTITVVDKSGFTRVVTTSSSTGFTKDGETSSLADLDPGMFIRVLGSVGEDGSTLNAARVASGKPIRDKQAKGKPDA